MLGSRFLKADHGHAVRHGVAYRTLEGGFNVLTRWYEATLRIALRFHPVTFAIALLMLVGHRLPVQDHAHRLHSQPGQRLPVRHHPGAAGHFLRLHGSAHQGRGRYRRGAIRTCRDVGVFVPAGAGFNQGAFFAHMKPRNERTHSVDQIIEQLRPQGRGSARHLHLHAESAAHHHQRTVRRSHLSAHAAEHQSERDLHLGAATDGPHAPVARLRGRAVSDMQISSPQMMVDIDRDRAQALGITPQQVQDALFSGFSQREVSVIYAPANQYSVILEAAAAIPAHARRAVEAVPAVVRGRAGAARHAWCARTARPGRCRSTTSASCPR